MLERETYTVQTMNEQMKSQFHKLRLPVNALIVFALAHTLFLGSPQPVYAQNDPNVSAGRPVEACEFPDLASIEVPIDHYASTFCSANLIDIDHDGLSQALLTSAHCLDSVLEQNNPSKIVAKVGYDKSQAEPLWVTDMAVHPTEDLAVLQLQNPITDTNCIASGTLGTSVNLEEPVTLAGFGKTDPFSEEIPDIAQTATTFLHTGLSSCKQYDPDLLCYGDPGMFPSKDLVNTQAGDSGSSIRQNGEFVGVTQIGVSTESVGGAVDITIPENHDWLVAAVQKFDTEQVENIPPETEVAFNPTYEENYIIGEEQKVIYDISAQKNPSVTPTEVNINQISAKLHFPCFEILSVEHKDGEILIFPQDENSQNTITFEPNVSNFFDEQLIITVKATLNDGCTSHPFGIGSGYFDATLNARMSYMDGENEVQKDISLNRIEHPQIYTPFPVPVEMEENSRYTLYENTTGTKKMVAERVGYDLHVTGYTDLGDKFLVQVYGQNYFVQGTPVIINNAQIRTLFDQVIPDVFDTRQQTFIPLAINPIDKQYMPSIQNH